MDVKLKVLQGPQAGKELPIPVNKFMIGRSEDCHLRPSSEMISRHHCVLLVDEGYVGVRDFGSRNGTFVNGEQVSGERELKPGDRLKIGPLEFEVVIDHVVGGKKLPPVHSLKEAVARAAAGPPTNKFDVDSWLSGEPVAAPPSSETVPVRAVAELTDTQSSTPAVPAADPAPAPVPPAPAVEKGKKPVGKLPPVPKTTTANSQDAAAKMLEQLRKRR